MSNIYVKGHLVHKLLSTHIDTHTRTISRLLYLDH